MKILLKTFTGRLLSEKEVDESSKVEVLRSVLETEYDPASLKLVYNGSVVSPEKTFSEIGAREDGCTFIIVGKKKGLPKAEPKKEPTPEEEQKKSEPIEAKEQKTEEKKTIEKDSTEKEKDNPPKAEEAPKDKEAVRPSEDASPPPPPAPASVTPTPLGEGAAVENLVDSIVAMGFEDRAQIALALQAAYLNPERAVEYLCTGIPANVLREISEPPVTQRPPASRPAPASVPTSTPTPAPAPVSSLRSALFSTVPNFANIREVYQENNTTMPTIMTQMAERYPELYNQISEKPEEFLAIMNETGNEGGAQSAEAIEDTETGGVGGATGSFSAPLTPDQESCVNQLTELGGGLWDRDSAELVYRATGLNQEIAASVLFEHGGVPVELIQMLANLDAGGVLDEDEEGEDEDDGAA